MTDLLKDLEAVALLAEKAQGEWRLKDCKSDPTIYQIVDATEMVIAFPRRGTGGAQEKRAREDAAHLIAAAVNFLRTHHAEIAEAVADARRYRALKELTRKDWTVAKDSARGGVFQFIGDELDAAIDAQHNSAREG
jgi:hypothetical protein